MLTLDPDAEDKALLVQTKRFVLYIIRVQQGNNLMEILLKHVTHEDQYRWEQLLREEMSNQRGSPYSETLYDDLVG